jgi:hypothetical protein
MSPEFEDMRRKVEGWVEEFKRWLALPLREKLMEIALKLKDVTGIDFPGYLKSVFDIADDIDERGLLTVVEEWIDKGLDYIADNWKSWANTVEENLMDMFWFAVDELKKKVEENKEGLNQWFAEIVTRFLAWLLTKAVEWGMGIKDRFDDALAWFLQLLRIDVPTVANDLKSWFSSVISGWITRLNSSISAWANDLKEWMRSLINDFVARVNVSSASWVSGLSSIGASIVSAVKSGITGAQDMANQLNSLLLTMRDAVASYVLNSLWNRMRSVGEYLVAAIKSGISSAWTNLVIWFKELIAALAGLLGGGGTSSDVYDPPDPPDGKDGTSYNRVLPPKDKLIDQGRAIAESLASGIDLAPVRRALQTELAITNKMLVAAGAGSVGGLTVQQQFGDVVFPNVSDGRDALGVRRELDRNALRASMASRTLKR